MQEQRQEESKEHDDGNNHNVANHPLLVQILVSIESQFTHGYKEKKIKRNRAISNEISKKTLTSVNTRQEESKEHDDGNNHNVANHPLLVQILVSIESQFTHGYKEKKIKRNRAISNEISKKTLMGVTRQCDDRKCPKRTEKS